MTKYHTLPQLQEKEKKEVKKTIFKQMVWYSVEEGNTIYKALSKPEMFKNVMLLWRDSLYGDVFRCWDDNPNNCSIYFGIAGDEFKQ